MLSLFLNSYTRNKNESSIHSSSKHKGLSQMLLTFVLCAFFLAMAIYCKICCRGSSMTYLEYTVHLDEPNRTVNSRSVDSDSIYEPPLDRLPLDRPPSYNEACSAPPLYTSSLHRVSMLEAPPVYPEIPTVSDRVSHANNQVFVVTNYI